MSRVTFLSVARYTLLGVILVGDIPTVLAQQTEPPRASVSGRLTMLDRGNRPARDMGQAVIWLEGTVAEEVTPRRAEVLMTDKEFEPRVMVVPAGSTVRFPNRDGFNHNVFSSSEVAAFDLGLYGRGEARSFRFTRPGVVRVFCNVHAQMIGVIVVRDNPHFTQPGDDGRFRISGVPHGTYILHAWHERAAEVPPRLIEVTSSGVADLSLQLDARGYRFVQHTDKHGRPYSQRGRRY